jgi:hypothetical protein
MLWYENACAIEEATRLEKNEIKGKVDHPARGSKDLTDSVAAVCYHCFTQPSTAPSIITHGDMEDKPVEASKKRDIIDLLLDEAENGVDRYSAYRYGEEW